MKVKGKILIGNWKANKSSDDCVNYFNCLNIFLRERVPDVNMVILPPSIYLDRLFGLGNEYGVCLGSQSADFKKITGNVTVEMLSSVGVSYVLVGHRERRDAGSEAPNKISNVILDSNLRGLTPIYCFGESSEIYDTKDAVRYVERQIEADFFDEKVSRIENLILAYEPGWAIGANTTPSSDHIVSVLDGALSKLGKIYGGDFIQKISIVYGGSCDEDNIESLFLTKRLQGFLVGRKSLDPSIFYRMALKLEGF